MKSWLKNLTAIFACLWRLWPHMRGGRYLVVAVGVSSLAGGLFEGVGVSLLVPLLSLLLGGERATPMRPIGWLMNWLPGHSPSFYVLVFCVLVLMAIVAKNLVMYASQVLAAKLRRRIATNLRLALFERLHSAELHLFEQHTAGELANIFFTETSRTISMVEYLLLIWQRVAVAIFYLVMLLIISWPLTLITVALTALIGVSVRFIYRRLRQSGERIVDINQRLSSLVLETFAGIRVVRSTHSQQREIERFQALNKAQGSIEERTSWTSLLLVPITEIVAVAGAMTIIGCAYYFFVRSGAMLSSYLLGFGFILLRLLPLVNQVYGLQGHTVYLAEAARHVQRWLEAPQYPGRPFGTAKFSGVRQSIRFEHIGFTYANGTQALDDVSFEIPAGRTVALVGASGSGKTTIASLLLRFRYPTAGRILVDGQDFWDFDPESWHGAIGVVEQEAFLFHDSMAQNIGYGFPEVSREAVEAAVKAAHLEDVVRALPDGLNTIVGERGMRFSGGQRQRLAIARALVRDPRILILDEATSSLDSLSERQVQVALEEAMKDRAVLVIAHRLSTVRNANHIVVLEAGRVVEQGSWDELVDRGAAFAKLMRSSILPAHPDALPPA